MTKRNEIYSLIITDLIYFLILFFITGTVFFQPHSEQCKKIQFGEHNYQPLSYFVTHFLTNFTSSRKDTTLRY